MENLIGLDVERVEELAAESGVVIHLYGKAEPRAGANVAKLQAAERQRIEAAIPRGSRVVALDERGTALGTQALADKLRAWQLGGGDVSLVIGGPDGLSETCRQKAHQLWSLSPLTLPHPLVRVIIADQIYRAWSILCNHPYHRA